MVQTHPKRPWAKPKSATRFEDSYLVLGSVCCRSEITAILCTVCSILAQGPSGALATGDRPWLPEAG